MATSLPKFTQVHVETNTDIKSFSEFHDGFTVLLKTRLYECESNEIVGRESDSGRHFDDAGSSARGCGD